MPPLFVRLGTRALALATLLALAGCGQHASSEADVARAIAALPAPARAHLLARFAPKPPPERTGVVTMRGKPVTLLGPDVKVGDALPHFTLLGLDMKPVQSADFAGHTLVLSVVPSLDTPVCESQTEHLAALEPRLPKGTELLTVSRDTPFAQRRFLEGAHLTMKAASDFQTGAFGETLGVLMKKSRLLARSVWVVDAHGRVAYRELVADESHEPDYGALMQGVERATQGHGAH